MFSTLKINFAVKVLLCGLFYFSFVESSVAQDFQIGLSSGPSALYAHENYYDESIAYYEGITFQADFTFLDSSHLATYGFSAYSNSVLSYYLYDNGNRHYNGLITNTGLVVSRYFERQFSEKFTANVQLGAGLNLETDYYNRSSLMLNLTVGLEVKYAIAENWFLLLKGIAAGQDLPNIVRYYTYGDYREAGEDLHLVSLFGVATNISRR